MTLLDAHEQQSEDLVGEDTRELFEAVEESFGVDVGDYGKLAEVSIRELALKVENLAGYSDQNACLSSVAFYKLRRAFEGLSLTPRNSMRPTTPVASLLPWSTRRIQWASLQEKLGSLTLPNLHAPGWVVLICVGAPVALLLSVRVFLGSQLSGGAIVFCSAVLIFLALRAVVPFFARVIPPDCETLGGLAKAVLARNYADFARVYGSSLESGVLPALRLLVAIKTGTNIENISPELRIPSDLNIE
jgi:hypothetical protein